MKNPLIIFLLVALFVVLIFPNVEAQAPKVGREAAGKYFEKDRKPAAITPEDHYLALHFGKFMESSAWEWGQKDRQEKSGNYFFGVTYKLYSYNDNMDLNIRVEGIEYDVVGEKPFKLSFMPFLTFPEATSRFPLYFGAGLGGGVFFRQVKDESYLTLDYQLVMGVRFFDVYENTGFFIETGLKNHLQVLNSGQFNAVFLAGGAVFTF